MQHGLLRSSPRRNRSEPGACYYGSLTKPSQPEEHAFSTAYTVGMVALALGAAAVKFTFGFWAPVTRVAAKAPDVPDATAGECRLEVPAREPRHLSAGELPDRTLAALRASKMDPRHNRLNALMD